MRARARGLSLTSTTCALPESRIARAASSSARLSPPSGGSSWIETTNSSVLQQPLQLRLAAAPRRARSSGAARRRRAGATAAGSRRPRRGSPRSPRASCRSSRRSRRRRACAPARRTPRSTPASRAGRRCAARRGSRGRRSAAPRARARRAASPAAPRARSPGPRRGSPRRPRRRARRAASRPAARETPPSVCASSSNVISATIGRLETLRTASIAVLELVEVVERLDHEDVGAAAFEDRRLLREELGARLRPQLDVAERPDRARDEDVAAGHLARLARQADARRVDPLELVLEEARRELRPVRAERVRLDQLGAGADVADVHRDDAVRRAHVRLLGAAQAGHGGRDERAHAAVGDDRRAGAQALLEAAHAR